MMSIWKRIAIGLLAPTMLALTACGGGGGGDRQLYVPDMQDGRLGVNGYLWRASLDTLDFMALESTDSQGGVIVSDWYISPDAPDERMKVTVHILDRRLRSDALRVSVHRQERGPGGDWQNASVRAGTAARLEEAILTRARQLRLETVGG